MKYLHTFLCLLLLILSAAAQKSAVYQCTFTDTLTNTAPIPDHIIRDIASKSARSKDLPDSVIGMLESALRKSIMFGGIPTQLRQRRVEAKEDTTTVVMSDEVINLGLNQTGGYKMMKIVKGRKIVAAYGDDNELLDIPPDEDRHFQPTGETRTILSYLCKQYLSADGKVTIWVTTDLPSWINPGVRGVDIDGAILSFTIERDGGRLVSTIEKLEIIK